LTGWRGYATFGPRTARDRARPSQLSLSTSKRSRREREHATDQHLTSVARKQAIKQINALVPGLADEQITSRAPGLSVAHAETAAQADAAGNAATVDGQRVTKIFAKLPPGTINRTIATINAFRIRATCSAGGAVQELILDPSATDATLQVESNGFPDGPDFDSNADGELNDINLNGGGSNVGTSTFSAARSGGFNLVGMIGYDDPLTFDGENVCSVHGLVISG
jgi:hypothetical protein